MLATINAAILCAISAVPRTWALPTWPSIVDELEDLMFIHTGYRARGFAAGVTPCSFSQQGPSRIAAGEWLRTAFHDMATGNNFTGVGGLDASLVFELGGTGGENTGQGFNTTLETFTPFYSSRTPMADLIALGVYTSVRSCGGPIVKVRAGRVDATGRGPVGVPVPENSQRTFINQFARVGFNVSEMIAAVACGHTLGGVHSSNFPQILSPGSAPNNFKLFDGTATFDEKIAANFIGNIEQNPLTGELARRNTRDSDNKVFTADRNVTISAMTNPEYFRSTCARILQKMIEVVPKTVTLTDPIEPYEVKPVGLQLLLLGNGSDLVFAGEIRVRTTHRSSSEISKVELLIKDRTGGSNCGSCTISSEKKGEAAGFDDKFNFYGFSTKLPVAVSISGFYVKIFVTSGETITFDNNGSGYPVDDTIIYQPNQSCFAAVDGVGNLTVVAAVRNTVTAPANLTLTSKTPRNCCVVPELTTTTIPMRKHGDIGPYTFYSTSYPLPPSLKLSTKFDVSVNAESGIKIDGFKNTAELGSICVPIGSDGSSEPPYTYEGCFTDTVYSRSLTGAAFVSDKLTIQECSSMCKAYQFFGLEYGRECYCGNTKNSGSVSVGDTDCSTPCGGDSSQICGAPNRLSLYKNKQWVPTVNPKIEGYDHLGCYSDSPSNRTLSGNFVYNTTMTVEYCASFCKAAEYFGVEYFSECYCGASISPGSSKQPDSDCSFLCSGNSQQYCGGSNRMNLYGRPVAPTGG